MKHCRQMFRNSISGFSCIHSDQVSKVSIIHLSFIIKCIDQNEAAACLCGKSIQYYFHAPIFHTRIVLALQELNLQKTAVRTLITHNCWKYCVSILFQCINTLSWNDTCGSVSLSKYLVHLIHILKKVGEFSKVQTALFLVFTQMKWTFYVSIIHFSFNSYSTYQNKTAACFCSSSIQYYFKSDVSLKPLFGLLLFITAGQHWCLEGDLSIVFLFFCFGSWLKNVF